MIADEMRRVDLSPIEAELNRALQAHAGVDDVPTGYEGYSAEVLRLVREYPEHQQRVMIAEMRKMLAARGIGIEEDGPGRRWRFALLQSTDAQPLAPDDASAVASVSARSLDHALAMLFIQLGPPPEPIERDYAPASNGGGGAQQ